MVHFHRIAHKSTGGCLTVSQLALHGNPCQQEEPVEPQQEESAGPQQAEELAEPQQQEHVIHSQGDSNDTSNCTPLSGPDDSDSEPEPVRAASEFHSYGEESPTIPT
jgi:hypothetical protein